MSELYMFRAVASAISRILDLQSQGRVRLAGEELDELRKRIEIYAGNGKRDETLLTAAWDVMRLFDAGELSAALSEDSGADTYEIIGAFMRLKCALEDGGKP